jgi:hypothetical protein
MLTETSSLVDMLFNIETLPRSSEPISLGSYSLMLQGLAETTGAGNPHSTIPR